MDLINEIISLDILPVIGHMRKGEYVSAHLHISVAYLIEADDKEKLTVKPDENSSVQWISIDDVGFYSNEVHMKKVYSKIISKIRQRV
jgi:ADP-ribose pyrophosphatase YjhB (NUDIX family)